MIRIAPIIHVLAILLGIIVLFMVFPLGIALLDRDMNSFKAFGKTIVVALLLCGLIFLSTRKSMQNHNLKTREGFLLVTFSWLAASAVGAIPMVLSGAIDTYTNAFFETMSGFTTTGASILESIETLPRAVLFWRSLTHWLGGMGIVMLTVAIVPFLGVGGVQLVQAEAPGPNLDKIAPKMTQTAKILWIIYMTFTILETVLLMGFGMDWFDALTHTFGTLATGGFSTRNASVGAYNSAAIDWIITIFMVMAGMNFGLYHKIFKRKFRDVAINSELKAYLLIYFSVVILIALSISGVYGSFFRSLRYSGFQTASILTTTGYVTADFDAWPAMAKGLLFFLMFIGGCSGSTGGGPKVVRIVGLLKLALNELRYLSHPLGISKIRINGNSVKKDFLYSLSGFMILYIVILLAVTLVVTGFGADLTTGFTSALATVGNIGPGFGMIGPTSNFAFYHPVVKWVLSMAMLAGRLEIYTFLILFTPAFWYRY